MKLSRRLLLGGGLALAGCRGLREEGPASADFPLGVASGDPDTEGALVWTRFVGRGDLRLELWKRDEPANKRALPVTTANEGIALVDVSGLESGTWWHYAFVSSVDGVDVSRSDEGRFRTVIADDALAPLHFGVSSCSNQNYPLTPFLRAAQELEVDAFLMLGDTIYADGAKTLEQYREKWREGLARRPNRLLRGSAALISTWDDHEIVNDASADQLEQAQIVAAREATHEYSPWRAAVDHPERLWRSIRYGRTAELFVLDCRGERNHATGEYLSRAQMDWLKAGLAKSDAVFKLILNSVPISSYSAAFFQLTKKDRWEGFPEQREEILRFIDETPIEHVLWLTGDFHMGVAGRVSLEGPGATQLEIAAGPAGQFSNPSPSYPGAPQFDFSTASTNVVSLQLDPMAKTARVRFLDGGSKVLFDKTYFE
ncbi:MAG: alkaline phosphatase D family protein [Myxococcota bacterium]